MKDRGEIDLEVEEKLAARPFSAEIKHAKHVLKLTAVVYANRSNRFQPVGIRGTLGIRRSFVGILGN